MNDNDINQAVHHMIVGSYGTTSNTVLWALYTLANMTREQNVVWMQQPH